MPRLGTLMMRLKLTLSSAIVDKPQIGQQIADFAAFIETHAANQFVRHALADAGFFQRAGLGIGAVHHGEVFVIQPLSVAQVFHHFDDKLGFFILAVGLEQREGCAAVLFGEQGFGCAVGVFVDDRPRRIQHNLGGAIILFQQDDFRLWEIRAELHAHCGNPRP